jgi:hypothetical protein
MRRSEVLHVRGETAGKNPPLAPRSRPWARRWRNLHDPPLQLAPAAPEACLSSPASPSRSRCPGSNKHLLAMMSVDERGAPPSELFSQNSCSLSLRPSRFTEARPSTPLLLPHSVDGPFHVKIFSVFSSLPCSRFSRPNRAGASNPGDDSRPNFAMRRRPWPPYGLLPACEEAPRRRRRPLRPLLGHNAAVLFLRGSLPPCPSSGRKGVWCSSRHRWRRRQTPVRFSTAYAIRLLRPPRPRFLAALGLQSSLTSSSPFSDFYPVRPGGV